MFGHMTDVGGKVPGSLPTDATSIFEEGVLVPPFKLYKAGELNTEMLGLILNQVRMKDWNRSDLNAIVAACRTAARRVTELCDRFGPETYLSTLDALLQRNYDAMKQLIATTIPAEETLTFTDYVCDDGMGFGPYKIHCSMYREGDGVVLDFAGTDPQSPGSINYYLNENLYKMFFGIYMIMVFDPQILWNDGFYPLVDVRIPEGTLLKPTYPAALSCRTHGLGRIFDILGGLLGQRQPEFLCAAGFSSSPHLMYSGYRADGEWFQLYQIGFGGIPGRPFGDGPDGHSLWPSFSNVPNEFLESYFPLRIESYETAAGLRRAGLLPRRQRDRRRLPVPGAGRHLHPRRPLVHLPLGRERRRAGGALAQVARARRRQPGDAAEQVRQRPRRGRRRAALRDLGRRRLGRPVHPGSRPGRAGGPARAGQRGRRRPVRRGAGRGRVGRPGRHREPAGASCPRSAARRRSSSAGRTSTTLRERCLEETGLPAPRPPVFRTAGAPA